MRPGKAYVSLHLLPLYMCPGLNERVSPALKKRMQGKTFFNFRNAPAPELMTELRKLTDAGFQSWADKEVAVNNPEAIGTVPISELFLE